MLTRSNPSKNSDQEGTSSKPSYRVYFTAYFTADFLGYFPHFMNNSLLRKSTHFSFGRGAGLLGNNYDIFPSALLSIML